MPASLWARSPSTFKWLVQTVQAVTDVPCAIVTAEALAGKDNFCMNYLKAYRAGSIEG